MQPVEEEPCLCIRRLLDLYMASFGPPKYLRHALWAREIVHFFVCVCVCVCVRAIDKGMQQRYNGGGLST